MSGDCDLDDVAAILGDECARTILAETIEESMSVNGLAERVDASKPTIYRRLEALEECEMITGRTRPDVGGHHHEVYRAAFDRLTVELTEEGYEYHVERTEPMSDRFTQFIEQI